MDHLQSIILQASEESIKKFDFPISDKRELIQHINTTFNKISKTAKEKFETLLLRDKVLKLIRHELFQISPSSSGKVIQGTCMDMCPEKERYSRDHLGLCHKYEFSEDSQQPDHYLMIKEYSRSSADQDLPLPNEMRPIEVLQDTMLYIIDRIIAKLEEFSTENDFVHNSEVFSIVEWYDFVWNRTRSIRKEIIQQRLLTSDSNPDLKGVLIIEQCARFHIMCSHRLCDQASEIFDFKINEENLKNCFQSLRQYYQTSHEHGSNLASSPNEAEFRSYIILLNLTESNILNEIQRWPKDIRHSRNVNFALRCYFAFNSKNYVKFFRLIESDECEYLQSCILHRHFYSARIDAFKTIFNSYKEIKEKAFPIDKLVEILGFDDSNEAYMYANMFGMEVTEDGLSFKMPSFRSSSIFDLDKTEKDTLRLRRSKIVENKFYIDHFYSNDLNNCDRLAVIISGMSIEEVNSSKFLSIEHLISSSFDEEGHFLSDEIEYYLNELRRTKEQQSVLKPLQNTQTNKIFKPILEIKKSKPLFGQDSKHIFGQDLKPDEADQTKKTQNQFSSLVTVPKTNLFEDLVKNKAVTTRTSFAPPSTIAPVVPPKIVVDMNKIAENINIEIIDDTIKTIIKDFISIYSKISTEFSTLYLDLIVKENIQNYLIEEMLYQQNLKYKNEAFNRISMEIGEQMLNQVISNICTDYFKTLISCENFIYDEILSSVFQKQFDFILKQIAAEISKDLFLDKLATKVYFDPENGLFNEDLLLTLHNTIFEHTRLCLNVNSDLYSEIKSSIKENQKRVLFQSWRLKLSIKLLQKQYRRSLNPNIGFLLKYAAFLTKNFSKLSSIKFYLYKNVHCASFTHHISSLTINLNQIFNNILLENYFNIINNNTNEILIDIPKPIQEVNIKTVLFCSRESILKKFFISEYSIVENIAINWLDPKEFGIKFCLKKYSSDQDLFRSNSIIYIIENLKIDAQILKLKNFKHILFISLFSREKTFKLIDEILGHRDQILVCCPLEDKNFFTIDQMFEVLMRQVLADECNRSPNLNSINLKDLLFETLIKFLDNSKNLMIEQCLHEFSQRFWRLVDILVKDNECKDVWPMLEFIPKEQETLKFWASDELKEFLRKKLWNLFSNEVDKERPEHFRASIEYQIENKRLELGNCEYSIGDVYVYVDMDLIRSIDWVEKEELHRKYSFGNMKRRISAEKKTIVLEKEKEEKSPKRLMLINQKVPNILEEKLKPIDSDLEKLLFQFENEKASTAKFESKLADMVSDSKEEETNGEIASSFDDFMKKLNDEKASNDKFNQKLKNILWRH